jgi:hypothetical protein
MKRNMNTLIAGVTATAALAAPLASCGRPEKPMPSISPSFSCEFRHPDNNTMDGETTAITGLAKAIEARYEKSPASSHLDGSKPKYTTAMQIALQRGGKIVLSYHASQLEPGKTVARASFADSVQAIIYSGDDEKAGEKTYRDDLLFNQLCTGGWMASWSGDLDKPLVATDANYHVVKAAHLAGPLNVDLNEQHAVKVIDQITAQANQVISTPEGQAPIDLPVPGAN